jgi:prepilin-type processing-associated H-X9-DG protein/prepilin-type N-terminal cleavage/methylation domain-containing protein
MNSPARPRTNQGAFTLVELLLVVAIIGVLAALLLPALAGLKKRAQRIQCVSNLRQDGISLQGFVADRHVYPLLRNRALSDDNDSKNINSWVDALGGHHYEAAGVWRCPAAQFPADHPAFPYGYNAWGSSSGALLSDLGLGGHTIPVPGSRLSLAPPIREPEVLSPSGMMAIGDSFYGDDILFRGILRQLQSEGIGYAASRHQGRANVVFCDGHVESPTLTLLFVDADDVTLVRWNRDHQPHRDRL